MSDSNPSLSELGRKISDLTCKIDQYLDANNLPKPSTIAGGPDSLPLVQDVQASKAALLDALSELSYLVVGPAEFLRHKTRTDPPDLWVLNILSNFNFWSAVPENGSSSYAQIANSVKLPEIMVRRILRHSMTMHVFAETSLGSNEIVHTRISLYCLRNPLVNSVIQHNAEECGSASQKITECLENYGASEEPGLSPMALAFMPNAPKEKTIFQFFEEDGDGERKGFRMKRFSQLMEYGSKLPSIGIGTKFIHLGFDWKALGDATVIDVGGNFGHVSFNLASTYPKLKCIVQDLPGLEARFNALRPAELSDRVSFEAHDFFTLQSTTADVYLFRIILHDWSDQYAAKILRNLIPAMKSGTKIYVIEGIVPQPGKFPKTIERQFTGADLQMYVGFNAKERTEEDWHTLFQLADKRFVLKCIKRIPESISAFMEIVWDASDLV